MLAELFQKVAYHIKNNQIWTIISRHIKNSKQHTEFSPALSGTTTVILKGNKKTTFLPLTKEVKTGELTPETTQKETPQRRARGPLAPRKQAGIRKPGKKPGGLTRDEIRQGKRKDEPKPRKARRLAMLPEEI